MSVKYTYAKEVAAPRLHQEIQESAILIALDYVLSKSPNVEIYFKDTLSSGDETLLDGIVTNHTNTPIADDIPPVDLYGKSMIHESSRPVGMNTVFTSQGDNIANPTDVGNGEKMQINHAVDDGLEQSTLIDLNIKENPTAIHEGYIIWKDANFDQISLSMVSTLTVYSVGVNTNYNLYGGVFIVPAAGDGIVAVQPADIRLVEMPIMEHNRMRPPAFWNADYNSTTHAFENITAAPTGDGVYNMFAAEINFGTLVNKAIFTDNGFLMLQTADAKNLGHGMRFKLISYTNGTDHAWQAACILTLHREKTAASVVAVPSESSLSSESSSSESSLSSESL